MNKSAFLSLVVFLCTVVAASAADGWQTIDLRAFTNASAFHDAKAEWLLPTGRQVFDGTPFHVDGVVQLFGTGRYQGRPDAPKIVKGIPIGTTFEKLHLLAAVDGSAPESNLVARIRLEYQGGSNAVLELKFGDQVRNWTAPMHKTERTLRDTNHAAIAWIGLHSDAASADRYARLFHVALENPQPAAVVRALTLEPVVTNCGPMIAGITVSPADAPRLTNTVNLPANPFPDMRKRNGELAALAGVVRTWDGQPISNAMVRVVAERGFNTQEYQSGRVSAAKNVSATTDADGRFSLPPLPDNKIYHVAALAAGRDVMFFNGADPKSEPVEIRLPEFKPTTGGFGVHVKVVDENGRAVAGALVEKDGVRNAGGTSWGSEQGFAKFAVSDAGGEFRFSRKEPFTALQMTISQPGFAPNKCWVDASNTMQTVTIDAGATLRGRVVKGGQPLTNVTIGVSGVDRNSEVFVGHYTTTTDTNGVFEFRNLPARKSWWLFGVMSSLKQHGAIRPRQLVTASAGETNEVDDLEVTAGLRLAGRVQTRHGETLPDGFGLTLGMEHWDSQSIKADKDGNFELTGLVSGKVEVNVQTDKWKFSSVNRSLDNWNGYELTGLLQQDKDDLLLVVEPGPREYNNNSMGGQLPPADYASARPIFGAEVSGPYPITLAGQVLDESTGKPLKKFKVVPGRKPPVTSMGTPVKPLLQQITGAFRKPVTPWNEMPWWDTVRSDMFSNGVFSVDFVPLTSTPMFRVEADGFEPFISEAMATNTTNLVIRLSSGSGPGGVVLLPDGKPAASANIWYAVAREQAGLNGRALNIYNGREGYRTNGADGRFSFPARSEGRKLFVAHPSGWAELEVKPDSTNLKITLAPWATVTGTLVSSNGTPLPGVTLHLNPVIEWNAGDPVINVQGNTVTDAKGKFFFTNALPVRLQVNREIPAGGGGWTYSLQTWSDCRPGITNDLGKVTYDSPPPPPFSEKVKRALGL